MIKILPSLTYSQYSSCSDSPEDYSPSSRSPRQAPNKKYFKRGELAARDAEEYRQRCGLVEEGAAPRRAAPQSVADADDDSAGGAQLSRAEVVRRLRDRAEPVLLFGETELEAFRRLRRLEILEPEVNRVSGARAPREAGLCRVLRFSMVYFWMFPWCPV